MTAKHAATRIYKMIRDIARAREQWEFENAHHSPSNKDAKEYFARYTSASINQPESAILIDLMSEIISQVRTP